MEMYTNFYTENKERIFAYLLHLTGDYHLSKDLVQESFTRYLDRYGNSCDNSSLLYTIARNAAFDIVRKRKHESLQPAYNVPLPVNPENNLSEKQAYNRILDAIQMLESDDRELIAMVATEKFSYREIGEMLCINEANVKVRVHRARLRLKNILDEGGE